MTILDECPRPGDHGCFLGCILLSIAAQAAAAGPVPRFDEVPDITYQDAAVFREVFDGAFDGTRHVLLIGDSQEVCPGGAVDHYYKRLNGEFFARYRNVPATPWTGMRVSYGGGAPWGHWLMRASSAAPGMTAGRVPADHHPPRFLPSKTSTAGGVNVNDNQAYGYLVQLQPDAASAHPGSGLAGKWTYFRAGSGVYLEVIAATHAESGEVLVRARPNDVPSANYFVPITGTFVTSMGLRTTEPGLRVGRLGPLPMGGRRYMQAEIAGNDPGRLTDVVAARFVSAEDGRGMALTPIAEGGYTSVSLLRNHAMCGPVLAAMDADAVIISYGANDAGQGFTPEQYKANLEVLIGWLREWISPTLPVILLTDGPHSLVTPLGAEYLARYAGANHMIAMEDPLVCAVNSRALLQRAGWTNETNTTFSPDGVHYNSEGSRLKARLEARILFEHFAPRRELSAVGPRQVCPADFDGDGFIDLFDAIAYAGCFESGECDADRSADMDGDGFVDFLDWSLFMEQFEAGCE